ncbi:sigma-54 dependent transcriptional regulator [Aquabacterium sp. A7-Y]|uniref:sigma-54-dependent transcriptional regulator n=1 Tax=Aquabacterium sp. A7-Y TaxID=1349605 RepID=UPI00223E2DF8|nr:sigma-54 dependent transcriptional regulator [Aquabacterium sp. A7-Y]MCW7537048.1 sigma-54 dependent transcriptional regulator [Aquabacterium sp. A7-Y]
MYHRDSRSASQRPSSPVRPPQGRLPAHALIVDDDGPTAETLARLVATEGYSTATARSLQDARLQLARRRPDVVLLDLRLPDGSGMELLNAKEALDQVPVVFVTAYASVETSIEALRRGAAHYLTKPVRIAELQSLLSSIARAPSGMPPAAAAVSVRAGPSVHAAERPASAAHRLLGTAPDMQTLRRAIAKVGRSDLPVLIEGETGVGKELVAQAIHEASRRAGKPFLVVHCGSLSPQLIESELFGHERGAFTGAHERRRGVFELAHGGALLLDDVTEMPPELQVKLLRVLEDGSFRPVGAVEAMRSDVRLISASNCSVDEAVRRGRLRDDLLYRLKVFPLRVPSLAERIEDLPLLAESFLAECRAREGVQRSFSREALQRLSRHSWPGNVRELRNAVQRAFLMASGPVIQARDIELMPLCRSHDGGDPQLTVQLPLGMQLADAYKAVTLATFRICRGHRNRTARLLGISKKTLYSRLVDYRLQDVPDPGSEEEPADGDATEGRPS